MYFLLCLLQIGNWSRWLTDLFGIDDDDSYGVQNDFNEDDIPECETSSKSFHLLNALSDFMMLPKDMLLSSSIRKEVLRVDLLCFIPCFPACSYLYSLLFYLKGMPYFWCSFDQENPAWLLSRRVLSWSDTGGGVWSIKCWGLSLK